MMAFIVHVRTDTRDDSYSAIAASWFDAFMAAADGCGDEPFRIAVQRA